MLVSEVRDRVSRQCGDEDLLIGQDADYYVWINEACLRIARETGINFGTSAAAANTYPVALPATWLRTKRVNYGNRPLKIVTMDELENLGVDTTIAAVPEYYYFTTEQLHLYPVAAASDATTVTHYFSASFTPVTAVSDTIPTPVGYDFDVLSFVRARLYERMHNYDLMEASMREFLNGKGERVEEGTTADDSYPVIQDDPRDYS